MAEPKELFNSKVVPVMNKVRADLQNKQADEFREHSFSLRGLMAGAAGPDGGMAATAAYNDTLRYNGKWNSKTVEDYVEMVKTELERQHIPVSPELEQMMIDKMVKDQIPQSSIDYVMHKAASHSLFGLTNELHKSPLQAEIEVRAEAEYNPSKTEKAIAWGIGTGVDYLALGGFGGGWKSAATFFGSDLAINAVVGDEEPTSTKKKTEQMAEEHEEDVPMVIAPEHREKFLEEKQQREKQEAKSANQPQSTSAPSSEAPVEEQASTQEQFQEQPEQTNQSGWDGLMQSFGLNGFSDIGRNMGYVLAMLPDMLVGIFTGKTKSLNIDNSLLPLASIFAGMFVRNPILKMLLIGVGGANLINKAGHEALENKANESLGARYKSYDDEPLNPRITNPVLQGHCLIAHIDNIPCTIQLPENVVGAYQAGALPINTLANAVLAKSDQMRQLAAERYEQNQQETITRTRGIQ